MAFSCNTVIPLSSVHAQLIPEMQLPLPGAMVPTSPGFVPVLIKGITIHPENPLQFDFIVDGGDSQPGREQLEAESIKLIKYFLASLTVPEKDLWVNLSPYEKDRIIPEGFGATEMGRDLLAQDYLLKQLTASLTYPENDLGKEFWNRVKEKARTKYGTAEIPISTFNKVWIVPEQAVVYEHSAGAFILQTHLKVMLEEDYLSLQNNLGKKEFGGDQVDSQNARAISKASSEAVREILIPEIEKEVNEGKNFANLRQIYHSMILAVWYKKALKESLLGQVYVDQNKVKGVDVEDREIKQKIYEHYLEAFKKGVYGYIKEDYDPQTQEVVAKKYFSGGFAGEEIGERITVVRPGELSATNQAMLARSAQGRRLSRIQTNLLDLGSLSDTSVLREALRARGSVVPVAQNEQARLEEIKSSGFVDFDTVQENNVPGWIKYVLTFLSQPAYEAQLSELKAIIREGRLRAGPDSKEIIRSLEDDGTRLVATNRETPPDEILIEALADKSAAQNFKEWKRELRSDAIQKLALYSAGVVSTTMAALSKYGIFDLFRDGQEFKPVTMREINEHVRGLGGGLYNTPNSQYIHGVLRILASLGWLTRDGKSASDDMVFTLTAKGKQAIPLAPHYAKVADFMPESIRVGDYLMGRPGAPSVVSDSTLKEMAALSAGGWGVPASVESPELIEEYRAHLDGYLISNLMMAMYEEGIFNRFDVDLTLNIADIKGDQERLRAAFDIFQNAGFVSINDDRVTLTQEGLVAFDRTLSYGVPVSYDPSYKLVEQLLFGDAKNVRRVREDGSEALVDRKRNVLGSGAAHSTYFHQVDKIIVDSVNRKINLGKIPAPEELSADAPFVLAWADTGSGDGTFLEHIYNVVIAKTKYGDLMQRFPELYKLEMVGIDYNEVAQRVTKERLDRAEISNSVLFGDINEPMDIVRNVDAKLTGKYGARARKNVIHTRTFLDHNRPWKDIKDTEAVKSRISQSTGAFGWRGEALTNEEIEQNLYEHFRSWAEALELESQNDLLIIELHTIPEDKAAANLRSTLDIAYQLSHLLSDQFIIEEPVYMALAKEAGFEPFPNKEYHKRYPSVDGLTTVSVHYFYRRNQLTKNVEQINDGILALNEKLSARLGRQIVQPESTIAFFKDYMKVDGEGIAKGLADALPDFVDRPEGKLMSLALTLLDNQAFDRDFIQGTMQDMDSILQIMRDQGNEWAFALPKADHWLTLSSSALSNEEAYRRRIMKIAEVSEVGASLLLGMMGPHLRWHNDLDNYDKVDTEAFPILLKAVLPYLKRLAESDDRIDQHKAQLISRAVNNGLTFIPGYWFGLDLDDHINDPKAGLKQYEQFLNKLFEDIGPENQVILEEVLTDYAGEFDAYLTVWDQSANGFGHLMHLVEHNRNAPDQPLSMWGVVTGAEEPAQKYIFDLARRLTEARLTNRDVPSFAAEQRLLQEVNAILQTTLVINKTVRELRQGNEIAAAQLISVIEQNTPISQRVIDKLASIKVESKPQRIGITGAVGVGKSTLVEAVIAQLRREGKRVAVLAIDPTSPVTGGAILADRMRLSPSLVTDPAVFYRSLGTRGGTGGIAKMTDAAAKVFDIFGIDSGNAKDVVLIETEGVGQSQKEIRQIVDTVVAAIVPEMGDILTLTKDSYLNVADVVVVNKSDRAGADQTAQTAQSVFSKPNQIGWTVPVIEVIALKERERGIADLVAAVGSHKQHLVSESVSRQSRAGTDREDSGFKNKVLVVELGENQSLARASELRDRGFEVVYVKHDAEQAFSLNNLQRSAVDEDAVVYIEVNDESQFSAASQVIEALTGQGIFTVVRGPSNFAVGGNEYTEILQTESTDGQAVASSIFNAQPQKDGRENSTTLTAKLDQLGLDARKAAAELMTQLENADVNTVNAFLQGQASSPKAYRVGITGPPGVGKSTLTAQVAKRLRSAGVKVGIIMSDPSNEVSGGALLIDRYRVNDFAFDEGIIVRSVALRRSTSGLAQSTEAIAAVMDKMGMDVILIETEGTGQTQDEVKEKVDTTVLTLSPSYLGDIQTMKSGSMEILDISVLNQADTERAFIALKDLQAGMTLHPRRPDEWTPRAVATVAPQGEGIDDFLEAVTDHIEFAVQKDPANERRAALAAKLKSFLSAQTIADDSVEQQQPLNLGDVPSPERPGAYPFTGGIFAQYRAGADGKKVYWTPRQYAGTATVPETNQRFLKIQKESSIPAFSLAFSNSTQVGISSDHPLAIYNIGEEGAPIDTLADMEQIFAGIDILNPEVSTSMTINASAPVLQAMYYAVAMKRLMADGMGKEEAFQWVHDNLRGTTQNDNIKEQSVRNNFGISALGSRILTNHMFEYNAGGKWNTISISGYHMREAGSSDVQEVAFTLMNAILYAESFLAYQADDPKVKVNQLLEQFSFFFDAFLFDETGEDFVREVAKFRAARRLWAKIAKHELQATDENKQKALNLRFHSQTSGVPLRSDDTGAEEMLNVVRILFESLAAIYGGTQTLHIDAYDEATNLPTEHSVQIAIESHKILREILGDDLPMDPLAAGGSDLLKKHVDAIAQAAYQLIRREMKFKTGEWNAEREAMIKQMIRTEVIDKLGSLDDAAERLAQYTDEIERDTWVLIKQLRKINVSDGPEAVVQFARDAIQDENVRKGMLRSARLMALGPQPSAVPSQPDVSVDDQALTDKMAPYAQRRSEVLARLQAFKDSRDNQALQEALSVLRQKAAEGENTMPYIVDSVLAGATVSETMDILREVFGDYRKSIFPSKTNRGQTIQVIKSARPVRIITAKPGLDGHDRGLNLIAAAFKNAGMEVIYGGIRQTPEMMARAAVQENVDFIGISSLSGARLHFIEDLMAALRDYGAENIKVIVGGITGDDGPYLKYMGVSEVFDPSHGNGEIHDALDYIQDWADRTIPSPDLLKNSSEENDFQRLVNYINRSDLPEAVYQVGTELSKLLTQKDESAKKQVSRLLVKLWVEAKNLPQGRGVLLSQQIEKILAFELFNADQVLFFREPLASAASELNVIQAKLKAAVNEQERRALFEEAWAVIRKYYDDLGPRNIFKIARTAERPEAAEIVSSFLFDNFQMLADDRDPLDAVKTERYIPEVEEIQEAMHRWGFNIIEATEYVIARRDANFDDESVLTGIGAFIDPVTNQKTDVMVIGLQKGSNYQEMVHRNLGLNRPWGYWKAVRAMRLAELLRIPVVTFVDSLGADNSLPSEINDQSGIVSYAIQVQQELTVPSINFILGEAGSAGSMTASQGGLVYMLANATRFVAAPEGSFSIANGDKMVEKIAAQRAETGGNTDKQVIKNEFLSVWADALHADAERSLKLGTISGVIPEVTGAFHRFPQPTFAAMGNVIGQFLRDHENMTTEQVKEERFRIVRSLGSKAGSDYEIREDIPSRTKSLIHKAEFEGLTEKVVDSLDPSFLTKPDEELRAVLHKSYKKERFWIEDRWMGGLLSRAMKAWKAEQNKTKDRLQKILLNVFASEPFSIQDRLEQLVDRNTDDQLEIIQELNAGLADVKIIDFYGILNREYPDLFAADTLETQLERARRSTGSLTGMFTGYVKIGGVETMLIVKDPRWLNASDTASAVGEKVALALEDVYRRKQEEGLVVPVVMINTASGARQQDGQRAMDLLTKKMAVLAKLKEAEIPVAIMTAYFSFGGDSASDTTYQDADLLLVEEGTIKGFTGPKVVYATEQGRRQRMRIKALNGGLPDAYQSARFLDEHGFIDDVVAMEDEKALFRAFVQSATGKAVTENAGIQELLEAIQKRREERVSRIRDREARLFSRGDGGVQVYLLRRKALETKIQGGNTWRHEKTDMVFRDGRYVLPTLYQGAFRHAPLKRTFEDNSPVNAPDMKREIIQFLLGLVEHQIKTHSKDTAYLKEMEQRKNKFEDLLVRLPQSSRPASNSAMLAAPGANSPVGGINLDPALLDLQIKRDGAGMPLPMHQQPIQNMRIEGFLPVIINIVPINSLPLLLGVADPEKDQRDFTDLQPEKPVKYQQHSQAATFLN